MKYDKIDNITIIYDEETSKQAEELKRIIENNKLLFQQIYGKNKVFSFNKVFPNAEYIENLDSFIRKIIDDNFYTEQLEKKINEEAGSLIVYLGYIIVENFSRETVENLYATEQGIDETIECLGESLYQKEIYEDILIKEYFDEHGTKEDFIEYFKTKQNKEQIIKKIKDKYRFKAYNYVLNNIVEYLKECGYFSPENMLEICGNVHFEMRELTLRKIIDPEELKNNIDALPKMNRFSLDKFFKEFLKEIDPEGILLKIYKDALRKRKIKLNKKFQGSFCVIRDNDAFLEIKETGTIKDFFTLAHEFMHYVINTYNKNSIPLAIEEFPSIFFEKYAIDFLERKGYTKEQLEVLHDFRYNDLKEKSFGMLNFLVADIIDKAKGKEVDDKRLREYVNILNQMIEQSNKSLSKEEHIEPYDVEEYINSDIDERTKAYFVGLMEYIEAFKYPISSYIALKTYDKFKIDKTIIEKIINYIFYAKNQTFRSTIELFEIEEDYQKLLKDIDSQAVKIKTK